MHRFFCRIAGVDPVALEDCPHTDRIWANQLGFSLVLNFFLLFGLTFYSVGYFIPELYARALVGFVVAAVLTMFDRALFQFDWFTVAMLQEARDLNRQTTILQGFLTFARPFWRLSLRLLISLAIAYTLSVFAEIAVFDSVIRERMLVDNYAENAPYRDKLSKFEKGLDEQRAGLTKRIGDLENEIDAVQRGLGSPAEQDEYDLLRMNAAQTRARIAALEISLAGNEERIRTLNEDIYAERYGLKDKPHRTGKPGCDPGGVCHEMVLAVKDLRDANAALRKDVDMLQTRAQELDDKASEFLKRRNATGEGVIAAKRREIASLRSEIVAFDAQATTLKTKYADELKRDGTYRELRDDPMIRIRILDELRQDPVRGPAITTMSYLIRAFIAFLELAPVLAKLFFAPPTVYSARIRTAVALGQNRALRERDDQLSRSPTGGDQHVYSLASVNSGDGNRLAHDPALQLSGPQSPGTQLPRAQLPTSQPRGPQPKQPRAPEANIPAPTTGSAPKTFVKFSLDDLNEFGMTTLREWIDSDPDHRRAASDYYISRLDQSQFLLDSDLEIVRYCQRHFDRDTKFFELGSGFGELSLCLALSGFHAVGFESDEGRHAGASALTAGLAAKGVDTSKILLAYGIYPDILRVDGLDLDSESVFVSTNVTSSLMMEIIDRVLHSLKHFDHLIIDLSRFGEVRDMPSRQALVVQLQALGFREVSRLYAAGDSDIRHFQS